MFIWWTLGYSGNNLKLKSAIAATNAANKSLIIFLYKAFKETEIGVCIFLKFWITDCSVL